MISATRLRPHSDDEYVWSTVYLGNEYKLPACMAGWRVLDIGGNIGAFARACADRGATEIVSYEPCPENREVYVANLADVAAIVTLYPAAVWSATGCVMLRQHHTKHGHACKSLVMNLSQPGIMVPVVTFAQALSAAESEWDLCKIDCEGAEYALFDCDRDTIRRAQRYAIEFHLPHRHEEANWHMQSLGYRLDWRNNDQTTSIMHFTRV